MRTLLSLFLTSIRLFLKKAEGDAAAAANRRAILFCQHGAAGIGPDTAHGKIGRKIYGVLRGQFIVVLGLREDRGRIPDRRKGSHPFCADNGPAVCEFRKIGIPVAARFLRFDIMRVLIAHDVFEYVFIRADMLVDVALLRTVRTLPQRIELPRQTHSESETRQIF